MGQQTKMMNAQTHVSAIVGELGAWRGTGRGEEGRVLSGSLWDKPINMRATFVL